MPVVACAVANCEYWKKGNKCGADMIMIEVDKHANANFDAEFAGEGFDTEHQDVAAEVKSTCCHTFKQKS